MLYCWCPQLSTGRFHAKVNFDTTVLPRCANVDMVELCPLWDVDYIKLQGLSI